MGKFLSCLCATPVPHSHGLIKIAKYLFTKIIMLSNRKKINVIEKTGGGEWDSEYFTNQRA